MSPVGTRRRLLAGSGLTAGLAVLALPTTAAVAPTSAAPVVALYAEWRVLDDARKVADKQHFEMRTALVNRYGECTRSLLATAAWKRNPIYREFAALNLRSTEMGNTAADVLDVLMDTPAVSMEGVRCKLLILAEVWAFIERQADEPDHHEIMTLVFARDAVRFMGAGAVA